jgi:hypothetical protein
VLEKLGLWAWNGNMEAAATPEDPGSNLENSRGGSLKRNFKFIVVLGLTVISLGLVGFVGTRDWSDHIAHPVSVTFLGYTNADRLGLNRLAVFRFTNRGRYRLLCDEQVMDIEVAGSWIRETNSMGFMDAPIIAVGDSTTVSMIAPIKGTRWRDSFYLTPLRGDRPLSTLEEFIKGLPLGSFRGRIWHSMFGLPPSCVVTSETLKL